MSEQLVTCLIAVAANLIGMIVIYAAMSNAIARRRTLTALALVLISQLVIMPRLAALRAAASAASYSDFARLHQWSVGLEGATLFLGLIVLYCETRS